MTHSKQRAKGRAHTLYAESSFREQQGFVNMWAYNTTEYGNPVVPVAVLCLDEYDATVERMARAYLNAKAKRMRFDFSWKNAPESVRDNVRSGIMAAFASIGIAAPKGRARK